jgi:hypothetical protein
LRLFFASEAQISSSDFFQVASTLLSREGNFLLLTSRKKLLSNFRYTKKEIRARSLFSMVDFETRVFAGTPVTFAKIPGDPVRFVPLQYSLMPFPVRFSRTTFHFYFYFFQKRIFDICVEAKWNERRRTVHGSKAIARFVFL